MVITATLPMGFPAVSVAQGRKYPGTTVTVPPQQLWLGLNLTALDLNSARLRRSCTLSSWGLFLNTVPPSKASGDSKENCLCLPT